MTSVKNFIIEGYYIIRKQKFPFRKELRAIKKEDALEKIYSELGGQSKVPRRMFKITNITEI
ncbi:MAG: 50S ribosomal protein L18Ae [Candidatus Odinarchaeia archaeon]